MRKNPVILARNKEADPVGTGSKKPAILFVTDSYPPSLSPQARMVHELAHDFMRQGYVVTVLAGGDKRQDVRQKDRFRLLTVPYKPAKGRLVPYLLFMMRMAVALMRVERHDIIVSLSKPPFLANLCAYVAGRRHMAHVHWCYAIYPDLFHQDGVVLPAWLLRRLRLRTRKMMKGADAVVVSGGCMARHLTHTGVEPRKITAIEGWADADLCDPDYEYPAPEERGKLSRRHNQATQKLKSDPVYPKFRILHAGHLEKTAELLTVLRAARRLQKDHPEIEFVFTGHGNGMEYLTQERARLGIDNIRLMPPQPRSNLKTMMESGDVHLICMRDGVMGMRVPVKVFSSFAVQRPCVFVGPSKSTAARIIERNGAGDVVHTGEDRKLAQALRRYRMDANRWFEAQAGAVKAHQECAPSAAFAKWTTLIEQIGTRK